jgi:hypothetical protein
MLFFKMMSRCLSMHNLVVVVEVVEVEVDDRLRIVVGLVSELVVVPHKLVMWLVHVVLQVLLV